MTAPRLTRAGFEYTVGTLPPAARKLARALGVRVEVYCYGRAGAGVVWMFGYGGRGECGSYCPGTRYVRAFGVWKRVRNGHEALRLVARLAQKAIGRVA